MKVLYRAHGTFVHGQWTFLLIAGHDCMLPQMTTAFSLFELIVEIDLSIESAQTRLDADVRYLGEFIPFSTDNTILGYRTRSCGGVEGFSR